MKAMASKTLPKMPISEYPIILSQVIGYYAGDYITFVAGHSENNFKALPRFKDNIL
jgi:hypothetical protein